MAQVQLTGADSDSMLEALTPTDVAGIGEGRVRYSMFLDASGGVLDDLMVARLEAICTLSSTPVGPRMILPTSRPTLSAMSR